MSTKTKRIIGVILCLALVASFFIILYSCSSAPVYELGPYSISEDEYVYLLSSYKRSILDEMGITDAYLTYPMQSGSDTTYGEYIEEMYRSEFEQSVYTLLYCQALFDDYGLSLTEEQENSYKSAAQTIIHYYGDGSRERFNSYVSDYGFSSDTIYSVYEKRQKEQAVINYILGDNYSKLTEEQKNNHYKDNYIHFQIIIVNSLYRKNEDGTFSNLSEGERESMIKLESELTSLLCREDLNAPYQILPSLLGKEVVITNENGEKEFNVTYEEIWSNPKINDDSAYPGGYYMAKPGVYELASGTTLAIAFQTKEGDVSVLAAKRFFDGNGNITSGKDQTEIKKGDYFEYGSAFVKRLPLENEAWKDNTNKDFFGEDSFLTGAAQSAILKFFQDYEEKSTYTLLVDEGIKESYTFSSVLTNDIDYDYLHPSEDEEEAE